MQPVIAKMTVAEMLSTTQRGLRFGTLFLLCDTVSAPSLGPWFHTVRNASTLESSPGQGIAAPRDSAFRSVVQAGPLEFRPNVPIAETRDGQVSGATAESRAPPSD
jgi:hypothetical protein